MFFSGAKKIANLVHQPNMTYDGDPALILDWIFYHDTLYKFSIRHWVKKQDDQVMLAAQEKIVSKAVFSPMRQMVSSFHSHTHTHTHTHPGRLFVPTLMLLDPHVGGLLTRAALPDVPSHRRRTRRPPILRLGRSRKSPAYAESGTVMVPWGN